MKIVSFEKKYFPSVLKIYIEGIATGIATFETKIPAWEQWDKKFLKVGSFVLLVDNEVAAWCALSAVSNREVYKGVAENTIYVSKEHQGKGIGEMLLKHLVSESEKLGFWTLQAGIFSQNATSIKLHERCGFRILGVREKIAQREGLWHDNVIMERRSKIVGLSLIENEFSTKKTPTFVDNIMKNILVLCTGNSCRSQMAHGYLEKFSEGLPAGKAGKAKIYSAGIETHGLNPGAVKTMAQDGIDITHHTSNNVDEYSGIDWDFIITVCDHAYENCPFIAAPNAKRLHHNFYDPSKFVGSIEETEVAFAKARDEIKEFCKIFIAENLV